MRFMAIIFSLVFFTIAAAAQSQPDLIYYGWDSPDISDLTSFITKLPESPFAGAGIFAGNHRNVFRATTFPEAEYQEDLLRLSQLKPGSLGHSFLVINTTTDAQFDWTNEAQWQATLKNTAMIARMAKAGGFKGIMFDMEAYGFNLWKFNAVTDRHPMAYAEAQKLLEQRGQSMMQTIEVEYPHPQMFFLWGLSAEQDWVAAIPAITPTETAMTLGPSGLWPAFFGGMVKAASPQTLIVDGNERSYYFLSENDFANSRQHVINDLADLLPEDARAAYTNKVEVGQAIYADYILNSNNSPRQFGYFLANEDEQLQVLKAHVAFAMAKAQSVAWYYTENSGWWRNPNAKITKAIVDGKAAAASGSEASLVAAPATAIDAFSKRRIISGKFVSAVPTPPPTIHFAPTLADKACYIDTVSLNYVCVLPDGISITLQPQAPNVRFDPPQKDIVDLGGNLRGLDWAVLPP